MLLPISTSDNGKIMNHQSPKSLGSNPGCTIIYNIEKHGQQLGNVETKFCMGSCV